MRRSLLVILLFLTTPLAADGKVLGPADYLAILVDSRIHYNILPAPSKTPAEVTCPVVGDAMRAAPPKVKALIPHPGFDPPAGYLGRKTRDGVDIYAGNDGQWLGYALCKAVWANEQRFANQRSKAGGSVAEERACLYNQLMGAINKVTGERKNASQAEIAAALPPFERHLLDVFGAKVLDGYVLLEIIGRRCPDSLSMLDETQRKAVDAYVGRYAAAPAQ